MLGPAGHQLEVAVRDAPTDVARVRVADALLVRQLHAAAHCAAAPLEARVQHAVGRIYATRGRITVDALGAELALGYRALQRAFAASVGVGPKRLARIVRFNHAVVLLRRLGAPGAPSITHGWVAHEAGYADHAHLIRDFHEFAHDPPTTFLARRYGIVEVSRPALERRVLGMSNSFNVRR